jgi:DNA-binding protein HU-beta
VNKAELIEALSARVGEKRAAAQALDAVLTEIQNAVTKGDKVSITGFGVFEKRVRAARTARNPRTGEAVKVKKTAVPAFRPGAGFREVVASGKVPRTAAATKTATTTAATKAATKTTATKATATRRAATKTAGTKATAARSTATKSIGVKATRASTAAPARKTAATNAAAAPARKTTTAKVAGATKKAAPAKNR